MARGKNIDTGGKNIILITKVNFKLQLAVKIKKKIAGEGGENYVIFPPLAIFIPHKEVCERDFFNK
jgi:hypothetical protein